MYGFYVWGLLVASMCGFYVWLLLLASTSGSYVWLLCVASMCGSYVWLLCVAAMSGFYVWLLRVASTCGSSVWDRPPLTNAPTRRTLMGPFYANGHPNPVVCHVPLLLEMKSTHVYDQFVGQAPALRHGLLLGLGTLENLPGGGATGGGVLGGD